VSHIRQIYEYNGDWEVQLVHPDIEQAMQLLLVVAKYPLIQLHVKLSTAIVLNIEESQLRQREEELL